MNKVCSKTARWIFVLMLMIPGSILSAEDPPSAQDQAVREAQPVATTPVPPALRQALASSLSEAASFGTKAIPTPPTGSWGIVSEGDGGGGIFRDSDSEAEAWLGTNEYGVMGFGSAMGGYFVDSDSSGYANVGNGDYGIWAYGNSGGGYFKDLDGTGFALVGYDRPVGATDSFGDANDGEYGVYAGGSKAGGYFEDNDGTGYSYVGYGDYGILAYGNTAGGYFSDRGNTGVAWVGYSGAGIEAYGTGSGGYFKDSDQSGYAYVGSGDYGIRAVGSYTGGFFQNTNNTAYASVGFGDRGIEAYGKTMGGYFEDFDGTGFAYVAYDRTSGVDSGGFPNVGEYGLYAGGNTGGAYFEDSDDSGYAYLGWRHYGIKAHGNSYGGFFSDLDGSGRAYVGTGDDGIQASGNTMGGLFEDSDGTGFAYVAYDRTSGVDSGGFPNVGEYGLYGGGKAAGAYFEDSDDSAYGYIGGGDYGISGFGNTLGGFFNDLNSSSYANVGYSTYKISGSGTMGFVQNHPYDLSSVIVYAAPEGDEIATYTRGTARLFEGEATVPLGETFKWVTNPDIGLTAHLTPREDCNGVYVADLSTKDMVVRELQNGSSDCAFDYIVYGLRIGFEESSIVQEKEMESYIPSMADHRQLYERRPDLKSFNSLERFKSMHHAISPKTRLDLTRAHALRDAIIEFDPAVHELPRPPGFEEMTREDVNTGIEGHEEGVQGGERVRVARADQDRRLAPGHSAVSATIPVDDEGNVYATSFRPSSQDLASLVDVSEEVQPGDVLVIDRDNPGMMRKAFEAHDTGVIGVVALDAGVVLGTRPTDARISRMHDSEIEGPAPDDNELSTAPSHRAAVGLAGVVTCNVDAAYGAVWPGDLLVTSPTPGHAMRAEAPLPGTMLGKALEPLKEGVGTIKVLVMLR